ncbi:MAG: 50S ribosomal protein L3 [Deltaproteobacteria bacterium]|nr:MAG: 50S ribosomal protein L3 [Deltaproteobacteria bacterium]
MAIELLCRKLGMTRVYAEDGESIGVTVLEAGPNTVIQKKTPERDGYAALQLGFGARRPIRTTKPLAGHFEKAGVAPTRHLAESRIGAEELEQHEVGGEIRVDMFEKGQRVDVIGTSRGRGTTGVVKRHGFKIHSLSHGTHEFFRHGGSIGAGASPGRVIKGKKMAGRYGDGRVTTRNLEVVGVDPERNLLLLRGAVPGHKNGLVRVCHSAQRSG